MRTWLTIVLAFCLLTPSSLGARGKRAANKFIVLVRLDKGVPSVWEDEIQKTAHAAAATKAGLEILPPPQVSLEETRMLLGCSEWDAGCVAMIGDTLGAQRVLYVEVTQVESSPPFLTMLHVAVRNPKSAMPLRISLPDLDATGLQVTSAFVRGMVVGNVPAVMVVKTDIDGARVFVDDNLAGNSPLVIDSGLEAGEHALRIELSGHEVVQRQVQVQRSRLMNVYINIPKQTVAKAVTVEVKPAEQQSNNTKTLTANATGAASVPATTNAAKPDNETMYPRWNSPVALAGLGVGVLSLVAGGVLAGFYYFVEGAALEADASDGKIETMKWADYPVDGIYYGTTLIPSWICLGAGTIVTGLGAVALLWPIGDAE